MKGWGKKMRQKESCIWVNDPLMYLHCASCAVKFSGRGDARRKPDHDRLERKAREAGWTFPRIARPGGKMRVHITLCPACSKPQVSKDAPAGGGL